MRVATESCFSAHSAVAFSPPTRTTGPLGRAGVGLGLAGESMTRDPARIDTPGFGDLGRGKPSTAATQENRPGGRYR